MFWRFCRTKPFMNSYSTSRVRQSNASPLFFGSPLISCTDKPICHGFDTFSHSVIFKKHYSGRFCTTLYEVITFHDMSTSIIWNLLSHCLAWKRLSRPSHHVYSRVENSYDCCENTKLRYAYFKSSLLAQINWRCTIHFQWKIKTSCNIDIVIDAQS